MQPGFPVTAGSVTRRDPQEGRGGFLEGEGLFSKHLRLLFTGEDMQIEYFKVNDFQ